MQYGTYCELLYPFMLRSIMFWNEEESAMLESLKKDINLVIFGDYGAGKTTGLVEAAILSAQAQQDQVTIQWF